MGEGEYENEHIEVSKKGRHRKKLLYNSILQLMEFYFSDSNLAKDRFLSQLISENPFVDINIFLKFNKIRKLNCTLDDIRKAISKSDMIELSECKERIRRKMPIKINENVDNCTIYVENIKADANHEWVSQIFSEFGNVVYVSIPKYRHNKTNKGFAFVEFEDENGAKNALTYFESIGCKMPSETNPENLKSIQTFQEKDADDLVNSEYATDTKANEPEELLSTTKRKKGEDSNESNKKRKLDCQETNKDQIEKNECDNISKSEEDLRESNKKIKADNDDSDPKTDHQENMEFEDTEHKKKKKHKKDKKKSVIKEIGLQILSKPEWKKMRNRYLDLQKKKMKEFKQYLNKPKFSQKHDKFKKGNIDNQQSSQEENQKEEPNVKLTFLRGVIVKVALPEPVIDAKKIKNEIKSFSSDIKYVDIPVPAGCEEIFVRFSNSECAKEFCNKEYPGDKTLLEGDEEQMYWEKIQNDRSIKFSKNVKKQRGRDKLLKKAEKERAKHIKFDEGE
ncbi:la-related protein 7 [Diabrotica undecimpunctata]|uniref:la-related protein 7 n=1 Tax=Diabrotica undecimpunctata TaxID=50387 RepID=UPI003B63A444